MIYSLHTKQISILYKCFKYFNQQQQNRKKVGMAVGWIEVNGLEMVRVGRWKLVGIAVGLTEVNDLKGREIGKTEVGGDGGGLD
jgi:hypothetical protein